MRGRFNPFDGRAIPVRMFAWAGNQEQDEELYRLRYLRINGSSPDWFATTTTGSNLNFWTSWTDLPPEPRELQRRNLVVLPTNGDYGSDHYDERSLYIVEPLYRRIVQTVSLEVPDISPTWCMEIKYQIKDTKIIQSTERSHNTIHNLTPSRDVARLPTRRIMHRNSGDPATGVSISGDQLLRLTQFDNDNLHKTPAAAPGESQS